MAPPDLLEQFATLAIHLSGWPFAADNDSYPAMCPDQSLYPVDQVPKMVERINHSFRHADEIQFSTDISPSDQGYVYYSVAIPRKLRADRRRCVCVPGDRP